MKTDRPAIIVPETLDELQTALEEWVADHGMIWFGTDTRLAEAIAAVLGIDLGWSLEP